jgi:hypothetical protein
VESVVPELEVGFQSPRLGHLDVGRLPEPGRIDVQGHHYGPPAGPRVVQDGDHVGGIGEGVIVDEDPRGARPRPGHGISRVDHDAATEGGRRKSGHGGQARQPL